MEEVDIGVVIETSPDGSAQVMVPRREGCRTWTKNICDQMDKDNVILRVQNPVKATKGRTVEVRFVTPPMGKSMFTIYILPILALIIGALGGMSLNPIGNENLSAVIGAFVLFIFSLGLIFGLNKKKWGLKGTNRPSITTTTSSESR